jgi:large subunit ribosomal protein L22
MSVKASAKSISHAPRKVEEVVGLVRNRSLSDAMVILQHTPRRAAQPVKKLLQSARANAEKNHGYKVDSLSISSIYVTPGSRLKRARPAAHGRALPFQKKSSHVFVEVDGQKKEKKKPAAKKSDATAKKETK